MLVFPEQPKIPAGVQRKLHDLAQDRQNKPSKHQPPSKSYKFLCVFCLFVSLDDLSELKNTRHTLLAQTVQAGTDLPKLSLSLATSRYLLQGACCDCWKYWWSCLITAQGPSGLKSLIHVPAGFGSPGCLAMTVKALSLFYTHFFIPSGSQFSIPNFPFLHRHSVTQSSPWWTSEDSVLLSENQCCLIPSYRYFTEVETRGLSGWRVGMLASQGARFVIDLNMACISLVPWKCFPSMGNTQGFGPSHRLQCFQGSACALLQPPQWFCLDVFVHI